MVRVAARGISRQREIVHSEVLQGGGRVWQGGGSVKICRLASLTTRATPPPSSAPAPPQRIVLKGRGTCPCRTVPWGPTWPSATIRPKNVDGGVGGSASTAAATDAASGPHASDTCGANCAKTLGLPYRATRRSFSLRRGSGSSYTQSGARWLGCEKRCVALTSMSDTRCKHGLLDTFIMAKLPAAKGAVSVTSHWPIAPAISATAAAMRSRHGRAGASWSRGAPAASHEKAVRNRVMWGVSARRRSISVLPSAALSRASAGGATSQRSGSQSSGVTHAYARMTRCVPPFQYAMWHVPSEAAAGKKIMYLRLSSPPPPRPARGGGCQRKRAPREAPHLPVAAPAAPAARPGAPAPGRTACSWPPCRNLQVREFIARNTHKHVENPFPS